MALRATPDSRARILEAAIDVIRAKGYEATRVEDICTAAGLTKGSFFHHFDSKERMAVETAGHWGTLTEAFFAAAPYQQPADPLDRLLAYVDFRRAMLTGTIAEYSCLIGTIVQEVYATHPALRDAAGRVIDGHLDTIEPIIAAAVRTRGVAGDWTARSLAIHTHAVVQGAFVMAKALNDTSAAVAALDHLRRYIVLLFGPAHATPG